MRALVLSALVILTASCGSERGPGQVRVYEACMAWKTKQTAYFVTNAVDSGDPAKIKELNELRDRQEEACDCTADELYPQLSDEGRLYLLSLYGVGEDRSSLDNPTKDNNLIDKMCK